jgi:hypothetical protein
LSAKPEDFELIFSVADSLCSSHFSSFFDLLVGLLAYLQATLVVASLYDDGIGGEEGKLGCHGQQQTRRMFESFSFPSFVLCF